MCPYMWIMPKRRIIHVYICMYVYVYASSYTLAYAQEKRRGSCQNDANSPTVPPPPCTQHKPRRCTRRVTPLQLKRWQRIVRSHIRTHGRTHVRMHIRTQLKRWQRTGGCAPAHIRTRIRTHVRTHVRTPGTRTHTRTHVRTHTRTHIRTRATCNSGCGALRQHPTATPSLFSHPRSSLQIRTHTRTHTRAHTRTHTRAHIRTATPSLSWHPRPSPHAAACWRRIWMMRSGRSSSGRDRSLSGSSLLPCRSCSLHI